MKSFYTIEDEIRSTALNPTSNKKKSFDSDTVRQNDSAYIPPSLRRFSDEVIPFKINSGARPLYKLFQPNLISEFVDNARNKSKEKGYVRATTENNLYLRRHLDSAGRKPSQKSNSSSDSLNDDAYTETDTLLGNSLLQTETTTRTTNPAEENDIPITYLCIGEKTQGREPGFDALRLDHDFWSALEENFNKILSEPRLKIHINFPLQNPNFNKLFASLLNSDSNFAREFSQYILSKNNQLPKPFVIWRFKQDYDEPNILGNVGPKGRLKKSRREENLNALREVINNDISTEMGYYTQIQQLKLSSYANGKIKFLTTNQLAPGYKDLSKAYNLTGDKQDPNSRKGLFRNFLTKIRSSFGGQHVGAKTENPPYMGTLLSLQLFLEDPDFIGAYGQNKGIIGDEILMIDLAKGLRGSKFTKIADSLQDNGQFELEIESFAKSRLDIFNLSRHYLFRNVSMLYDAPFSENMMGFHILNQFVHGNSNPNIIKSYPGFEDRFAKVQPRGLYKIFNRHVENLLALKNKMQSQEEKDEIDFYIDEVEKTREIAFENANRILRVFNKRLKMTAEQITLVSNLEKITSNTYDLTDDKKTQISHLQVETKSRIPWDIDSTIKPGYVRLTCNLTKNPLLSTQDRLNQIVNAFGKLRTFLNIKNLDILLDVIYLSKSENDAYIEVTKEQFEKLCTHITDEIVHDYKVPLHSAKTIIEATESVMSLYHNQNIHKFLEKRSYSGLFTKKPSEDLGSRIINNYQFFLQKNKMENINQQNTYKLISVLGILSNKGKTNLIQQMLTTLKADSVKTAISRVNMQIVNELLTLKPDLTVKELDKFKKLLANQLNAFNKAIEKNQPTKIINIRNQLILIVESCFQQYMLSPSSTLSIYFK